MTRVHLVLQIAQVAVSQADDLYLDDTGSGGYYPEDDDDFNSGSGSGKSTCTVMTGSSSSSLMRTHKCDSTVDLSVVLPSSSSLSLSNLFLRLYLISLSLPLIFLCLSFNRDLLVTQAASGKSANFMSFFY